MRGLTDIEREILRNLNKVCSGVAGSAHTNVKRLYMGDEVAALETLIKQGRIYDSPVVCHCGKTHFEITADGKQALILDAAVNSPINYV